MKRCILPVVALLLATTSDDLLDLGIVNKAEAQQRRYANRRRPQARRNYNNRNRGRYGRRTSPAQRYRSNQARQMQNIRNQINRQMQAYRAAMQKQQQAIAQQQRDAANGIYTLPNGQKVVKGFRDYELVTSGDATVRHLEPPVQFGADGSKEKLTAEELKELKGDKPNLIGYAAKFEDLAVGQYVKITCGTPRTDPKDKEKTIWVPAGQVAGQISSIDSVKIVVRVEGLVPQNVGKKIERIPVTDREARLIVIHKQGTPPTGGDAFPGFGGQGGFGDFGNFDKK